MEFNPDTLVLDKEMIVKIIKSIRRKWHKQNANASKNSQMASILETTEGFIEFTDVDVCNFLFSTMGQLVFEVMRLNALFQGAKENKNMEKLYEIALRNLELD